MKYLSNKLLQLILLGYVAVSSFEYNPKGYLVYCPCMGRFGNQVDQTLGVLQFAKFLDRTLILPNFVEYRHPETIMVPFEHIFQVSAVSKYLKVATMAEFTKHMSKLWPKNNRTVLCWSPRQSIYDSTLPVGCNAKEGNPFGPYWDKIGIDFTSDAYFGDIPGGFDLTTQGSVKTWTERFPPSEYPVLAFSSAPAPFPSRQNSWELQRYLKWNSRITARAKHFINSKITRPFLAVHLRNDMDWGRVCEHISPNGADQPLFASAQCLGEGHYDGKLTKEICSPSKDTIFGDIVTEVGRIGAKSVFIASDKDHMIEDINDALRAYDVVAHRLNPNDPYITLAILGQADHFIGNCVSTFSHIVKRERDHSSKLIKSTSFFGLQTKKRKVEL